MGTTPGVEADLGWALGAISRSYLRAARAAVADLPGGARGYLVLAVAGQGEPRSQLALAQHLGVDRTAMTYLLDDLEAAGLVERRPDPADRRARRVAPTPDGLALLREVKATLRDVEDGLLAPLDDEERVVLRGMLRRLATNVAPANPCEIAREFAEGGPAPGPAAPALRTGPGGLARRDHDRLSIGPAVLGGSGPSVPGRPGGTPYGGGVPLTGSVAITVVAALLVLVGLVGILVPVLPGPVLVVAGIAVWAVPRNDAVGWTVLGVAVALVVAGSVLKYLLPGRRMRDAGVPGRTLVAGGLLGIVGFFVVPVVGLLLGFVLGVYLAEMARIGRARAWPSARHALTAVGWSILIELAAALLATAVWVGALVLA